MSVSWHPAVRIANTVGTDYSGAGVDVWTEDARDVYRYSLQVVFADYTNVTVKMLATLDGTNYDTVAVGATTFQVTANKTIISAEVGPYQDVKINVVATSSGTPTTDVMQVWLQRSTLQR